MSVLVAKYPGIDSVVAAVKEWLSGPPFADAIADVMAARADGIDLPLPRTIIDADVDPKTITEFPAILVIGGTGESPDTGQAHQTTISVGVLVVVLINGDDPVLLAKIMQRYLLAVRLTFARTQTFFPLLPWGPSRLGSMVPDPTRGPVTGLNQRYLKAGSFDLVVDIDSES